MGPSRWTEDEVKQALYLYLQLPFGKIHSNNPEVIALAENFGRSPSSIAMKLANFASLDPEITGTGRKGLQGASELDRKVWNEFNNDWTRLIKEAEELSKKLSNKNNSFEEDVSNFEYESAYFDDSTIKSTIEKRIGQNFFRRSVLTNYNSMCCVTGISDIRLLNASHILPWSIDVENRHNPRNGLCLSATFDRAFDRGLMTVDEFNCIRLSKELLGSECLKTREFFHPYEKREMLAAVKISPNPAFLRWHRENQFK